MSDHDHDHDHDHDCGHDHDHHHDHAVADDLPEPVVTVADAGPARKKLTIEVPAERVAAKLEDNFHSLQDEAAVPGFRQGRAPLRLLERRFGKEVRNESRNQLVGEGYSHAIEKHELRVLGEPDFKDFEAIELPDEGPLSFEVEVEVVPEFDLPELKGIEVKKPVFEITDEQIDAEVDRFGEMYGRFEAVESAHHGDYATADVVIRAAGAKADDEALAEHTGAQMLVPGESRKFKGAVAGILVEDLGKSLAGKKVGESVTVKTTGPAQHENEALRGQDIEIEIALKRVERIKPLTAEELTQQMGMETVEELRDQVRQRLEHQAEAAQKQAMSQQVAAALLEKADLDQLPENLSARQADRILQRRAIELMQRGVSQQDIEQQLAELRAASQEQAQQELKMLFILDAAAHELKVEVDESEVNGRIVQMAVQQGKRPERFRAELQKSGQLQQLFVQLREEKTIEQILADAKVTEISADAWNAEQGGDAKPAAKKKTAKKKSSKKTAKKKSTKKKAD